MEKEVLINKQNKCYPGQSMELAQPGPNGRERR